MTWIGPDDLIRSCDEAETLGAFITPVPPDKIELSRHRSSGPLAGATFSAKDDLFTAGIRTTGGSQAFADFVPDRDAPVVARLKADGATLVGKTNLCEFAMTLEAGSPVGGPCRHPDDPTRWAGASSGGAAAAAALNAGDVAIATDTGGSARAPAALCGVTCYMPTPDAALRGGSFGANKSLLSIGCLSQEFEKAVAFGRHIRPDSVRTRPRSNPKIEWSCAAQSDKNTVATGLKSRCENALQRRIKSLPWPVPNETLAAFQIISDVERLEEMTSSGTLAPNLASNFSDSVRQRLGKARLHTDEDWAWALNSREVLRTAAKQLCGHIDVLISPATLMTAPRLDDVPEIATKGGFLDHLWWVNLQEWPAVVVPMGSHNGWPVAVQLTAPQGSDETLIALGRELLATKLPRA